MTKRNALRFLLTGKTYVILAGKPLENEHGNLSIMQASFKMMFRISTSCDFLGSKCQFCQFSRVFGN